MSLRNLKQFARVVMENQELRERLSGVSDQGSLVRLLVAMGEENGYTFSEQDVVNYLDLVSDEVEISYPLANLDEIPSVVVW
ncbi:Nif11-like leader peptide family natural product precursor [Allocoleopsis franciscana]|uniref:Nif11 domain-containing protein n=1 Tax=Allocoleopsis franciscana PCC 7113 TaxID=1173027 RepID=K9WF26_9CYAN|nr:Nif11-like leader peptide family natural product precursor [Allocoleopsis franciscana]AFZ18406.1 hypothetical protein Mic7113_2614 [Allocoleopsis franciscana PCC 7113]